VTTLDIVNNRLIPNAMEPRAANAIYTKHDQSYTLYVANQNPHVERLLMCAFVLGLPESKVRVIAPDVGGGFGSKIFLYPEETALVWASKRVGRPIKWTADRSEAFLTDAHGRDHVTKAELAMDAQGNFLALRVKTIANMGAYLSTFASSVPTILYATLLAGQYKTPAIYAEVQAVFTNTAPVDAYRGAGRPEATYVVERIVEQAAREMKMDPAQIRRQNFITEFPYATPVGLTYDVGNYAAHLDKAIEMADVAGFAARRKASEAKGKKRGLGYSCYIEACGIAPSNIAGALGARAGLFEAGEVRVHPTGTVTIFTGSHSHGQGHETTFAQVVAGQARHPGRQRRDRARRYRPHPVRHGHLRQPLARGRRHRDREGGRQGDREGQEDRGPPARGGRHRHRVRERRVQGQGHRQEGAVGQRLADRLRAAQLPARQARAGLNENAFYDPTNFTYPAGSYICEVEVDTETGQVKIEKFTAVDDFGNIVNPMIVAGQVHGGLGQGLGQAIMEGCNYDPQSGQLLTGSYMDYAMPRRWTCRATTSRPPVTACSHNPLGVKGCGEAGAIGSPPAYINALTDALGVKEIAMPATPERVWRAANQNAA
jgi:carbon-monoxide dehydrogenase large subunit